MGKSTSKTRRVAKSVKGTRSRQLAAAGIQTGDDFTELQGAIIADVLSGELSPGIANAAARAGSNMLECVKMQFKYGTTLRGRRVLHLAGAGPVIDGEAHVANGRAKLAGSK